MKTPQTAPLAPYGSMEHLAIVAKVGVPKKPNCTDKTARIVLRRSKAQ